MGEAVIHNLPVSWVEASFGAYLNIQGGSQPAKKFFSPEPFDGCVRLYQIRDLNGSPIPVYVDRSKVTKFCNADDIMIGRYGASVGKVFWGRDGAYNVALVRLLYNQSIFDKGYLYHFLKSPYFQRPLGLVSKTAQDGFNKTDLSRFLLPIPPANEQCRIVEKIETLFARLEKGEEALRAVQKLLGRYRQSVLKAAVTGQLTKDWRAENAHRLENGQDLLDRILKTRRETWQGRGKYKEPAAPDTTDLPELPEGWVWASLESLADQKPNSIVDGPFGSKLKTSHYQDSGVRVIRLENIGDGEFVNKESFISEDHADELFRHSIQPGDIAIASLGQELPRACIIPDIIEKAIVKADCIRFSPLRAAVNENFVLSWLNSWTLRRRVETQIRGVGRPRLNLSDIRSFAVPFPSKAEQDQIAKLVSDIETRITKLMSFCQTELTRSANLRQSILKDAFAGRLVPQDPSDEPAADLLARIKETAKGQTTTKGISRRKAKA